MKRTLTLLFFIACINSLHAEDTRKSLSEESIQLSTGIRLAYVEQGNTNGTPVIFLHGYSDSWHSFESTLPFFPENIHAFAITQRGHGNSSKPEKSYHPKDFAADVAAFIRSKNLGTVFIVGHSLGGVIAQQFVLDYPQLTRGIVLVSTDAAFNNNPGMPEFASEIQKLTDPIGYQFADEFQRSTCVKAIDTAYYHVLVNESLKLPAYVWKETAKGFMSVDYCKELKNINQPALIIWGDKDAYCLHNDQDVLSKGIRNAELIVYEETGHALHWEQPERFASDVTNFIEKVSAIDRDSDLHF